jgi:ferric-dicitrate binding protein FerR (iron transport regulator)
MRAGLDETIVAYLSGELSPEDLAALEDRLSRDPAARDRFARICFEDLALRELAILGVRARGRSRGRTRRRGTRPAPFSRIPALAAAGIFAGLVALLGTLGAPRGWTPREPVAAAPDPPPPAPEAPRSAQPRPVDEGPVPQSPPPVPAFPSPPAPGPSALPPDPPPAVPPPPPPWIDPAPARPAPEPTRTVVAVAHLERAADATVGDRPGRAGEPVPAGASIRTAGAGSHALLVFADGTRLELDSETHARDLFDQPRKSLRLERGSLRADVVPQPPGRPMAFRTPQAEATVLGTRLALRVEGGVTRLEVQEGRVRLTRLSDGASADVRAGFEAAAGPSARPRATPLRRFVKGINLNGPAVTIEGNRWISQAQALAEGLSFPREPQLTVTLVAPRPEADPETARMLNSAVFRTDDDLSLRQALPNGTYEVTLWVMENLQADFRAFDVRVEGILGGRNVGDKMKLGDWVKLGPFRAVVNDGALDVELIKKKGDPHLMGIAIFRVGVP